VENYISYLDALRTACKLVDLNEQQCYLRARLDKDNGIFSPFKEVKRQLQFLESGNCADWVYDNKITELLSNVLDAWDDQIVRLDRMIRVLSDLDKLQRKQGLGEDLRDKIHFIYQRMSWGDVEKSLSDIETNLKKPTGKTQERPAEPSMPTEDEDAWRKADSLGTLEAYDSYLKRAGLKNFEKDARNAIARIADILDSAAWQAAVSANSISSYSDYKQRAGHKKFLTDADKAISKLLEAAEEFLWKTACDKDTIESYNDYKSNSSIKKYLVEADSAISKLTASADQDLDDKNWSEAYCTNTLAAYESYRDGPGEKKKYLKKAIAAINSLAPPPTRDTVICGKCGKSYPLHFQGRRCPVDGTVII